MSDYKPVVLEPFWATSFLFGAYLHRGRVYLEGWITVDLFAATPADPTFVGTLDPSLLPATDLSVSIATDAQNSDDVNNALNTLTISSVSGAITLNGAVSPDRVDYTGAVNASWEQAPADDSPEYVLVDGLHMAKHGNHVHLDGSAVLHGSDVFATGIPSDYVPRPDAGSPVKIRLPVPILVDRPTMADVVGTTLQAASTLFKSTAHLTVRASDIGGTPDYGSWSSVNPVGTSDTVLTAGISTSDLDGAAGFRFNARLLISTSFADTTDDPTADLPGVVFCLNPSISPSYYKLLYEQTSGNFTRVLYRRAGGSWTRVWDDGGNTLPAAVDGFYHILMDVAVTPVAQWTGPGGYTTGLVIQVFSSPSLYSTLNDTSAAAIAMSVPGEQGFIQAPADTDYQGNCRLRYHDYADNRTVLPLTPDDGSVGDFTGLGWHVAVATSLVAGEAISGIVKL